MTFRAQILASIALVFLSIQLKAQFSPGDLSQAHAEYEGMDNCTLCHKVGAQVSDAKCLECHKEMQSLIDANRGYHSSLEVQEKSCVKCHSEHHGRGFDVLHFDTVNFDHFLTGYELEASHERINCADCHKPDYIGDDEIANREGTFIGLEPACLSCHIDYHREELGSDCLECHNYEVFTETPGFDHDKTDYPLKGAHREVNCIECHPKEIIDGRDFQNFSDIPFANCTDCHQDVHEGRFGSQCTDCHTENSWLQLQNTHRFNHDLTDYPLEGMHRGLACSECHSQGNFKQELAFARCTDCHDDYHEGEISDLSAGILDCDACHDLSQAFTWSGYDWEDHLDADFPLEGAHLATPCFACHKESEDSRWDFKFESNDCVSCHEDIHQGFISESYYPEQDCEQCHNAERWSMIDFDHQRTEWPLEGAHAEEDCRACHYEDDNQQFNTLEGGCVECHNNVHGDQFALNGVTTCTDCHRSAFEWKADLFDHQVTEFPLEGRHAEIDCAACHKPEIGPNGQERIKYKIENFQCIDCHGS